MISIKIVADAFAILIDDEVHAIVAKCNETQWGIYPLRPHKPPRCGGYLNYTIQRAMQEALEIEYI